MNLIKYLYIQCLLFTVIILINFYIGSYILAPFTYIDFIAIIIGVALLIPLVSLYGKLIKRLKPIFLLNKILLTLLAFVIASIFASIFAAIIAGEIQF